MSHCLPKILQFDPFKDRRIFKEFRQDLGQLKGLEILKIIARFQLPWLVIITDPQLFVVQVYRGEESFICWLPRLKGDKGAWTFFFRLSHRHGVNSAEFLKNCTQLCFVRSITESTYVDGRGCWNPLQLVFEVCLLRCHEKRRLPMQIDHLLIKVGKLLARCRNIYQKVISCEFYLVIPPLCVQN